MQTHGGFCIQEDRNLAYAIGHFTVLNPHVDKNGKFTGLLYDKYDFEPMKYNTNYTNNVTTFFNNEAVKLHNDGQLEYYYILAPIKFQMED